MKKILMAIVIIVAMQLSFVNQSYSDEIPELKEQIRLMQEQITEMQKKLDSLEKEKTAKLEPASDSEARVSALEKKLEEPYENGLYSLKHEKFEIGGWLEYEFVDTQYDASIGEPAPHFQLDSIYLQPKITFNEDITLRADLEFNGANTNVDELVVIFDNLPLNSKLTIGLEDRFITPNRKTERYPLAGTAFWADEEYCMILLTEHDPIYGILSISHGLETNRRDIGEDSSTNSAYRMLHDSTRTSNFPGIKQFSAGLGYKEELGKIGSLDMLGFGILGELSSNDIANLRTWLPSYISYEDDQYRVGGNFSYSLHELDFIGQYIYAHDGDIYRNAWFLQPSYKIKLPFEWKYCKSHDLLFRYGSYDINYAQSPGNSCTWDREEFTFAVISEISKNVLLKSEYTINEESTGARGINNNEFLMQLNMRY